MLPSQTELENRMSDMTWCDEHPHDCARFQKQQEREWLLAQDVAFGPQDVVVAAVIMGMCVLAIL